MWNARGTVNDTEGVDRRAVLGMGTLRESQARRGHPQPPTQVPPSTPQPRPRCPRYCRDHGRRARTTKKLLNGQRRSGNQVPTEDGWRGSQRIISSSLPSWTNWTEGQGDDQGPAVHIRSVDVTGARGVGRLRGHQGACGVFVLVGTPFGWFVFPSFGPPAPA